MRNPTLKLTHPEAKRNKLIAFARQIPGAYIGIKIAALLLLLEGQRPCWVIEVLGISRQSLNQWMHKINRKGLESLKDEPRSGRPTNINLQQAKILAKQLEKAPQTYGINRVQWDGPTLARHLQRQFGITLKVRQAQYWLHRLGFSLKKAAYSYVQANPHETVRFQRALKKTAAAKTQ